MVEDDATDLAMSDPAYRVAWGISSRIEHRWPASIAIIAATGLYLSLPERYTIGPTWLVPILELSILLPLSISAPRRIPQEGRLQQILAIVLIAVVNVANLGSLARLVNMLVWHGKELAGSELLFSALRIWLTNVIVFALWYWEIDRGGPDQRAHAKHGCPDFLFPQMSTPGCSRLDWCPGFIDYFYLAFTNATAFSPTDAMPLTPQAKMLMLAQSAISLVTITLVAARAVNILN